MENHSREKIDRYIEDTYSLFNESLDKLDVLNVYTEDAIKKKDYKRIKKATKSTIKIAKDISKKFERNSKRTYNGIWEILVTGGSVFEDCTNAINKKNITSEYNGVTANVSSSSPLIFGGNFDVVQQIWKTKKQNGDVKNLLTRSDKAIASVDKMDNAKLENYSKELDNLTDKFKENLKRNGRKYELKFNYSIDYSNLANFEGNLNTFTSTAKLAVKKLDNEIKALEKVYNNAKNLDSSKSKNYDEELKYKLERCRLLSSVMTKLLRETSYALYHTSLASGDLTIEVLSESKKRKKR